MRTRRFLCEAGSRCRNTGNARGDCLFDAREALEEPLEAVLVVLAVAGDAPPRSRC